MELIISFLSMVIMILLIGNISTTDKLNKNLSETRKELEFFNEQCQKFFGKNDKK